MNEQEINRKIAELCGWNIVSIRPDNVEHWKSPQGKDYYRACFIEECFPNYCSDLNAMHETEKILSHEEQSQYWVQLHHVIWLPVLADYPDAKMTEENIRIVMLSSTARQRAEAFLRVKWEWKE